MHIVAVVFNYPSNHNTSYTMRSFICIVVFLGFSAHKLSAVEFEKQIARYDNYHLYELTPTNDRHVELLKELEMASDSYVFLASPHALNDSIGVVVAPHKLAEFNSLVQTANIPNTIVQRNLQDHIDNEAKTNLRSGDVFGWTSYQRLDSIYNWLDNLAVDYPDVVSPITIGTSYEGRPIRGVRISKRSNNPGIFVEGGIHAREWISPAFVTYLINELLTSDNEMVREISESYDWYIVPSTNPDGYEYSHQSNRMWRKTRAPHGPRCYGTDANRNWDFHWGEFSTSKEPCSEIYGGSKAFSENETQSYANYLSGLKGKIQTFIGFHSYSQLILLPHGHTAEKPSNYKDLMQIGLAAADALAKRYGTKYKVGSIFTTIYPASGGSADYVYGVLGVPLSFTYELRPKGYSFGFELPADQIIPVGEETLDSVVELLRTAKKLGYNRKPSL